MLIRTDATLSEKLRVSAERHFDGLDGVPNFSTSTSQSKGAESGTFPTVTVKKDAIPFEKLRPATLAKPPLRVPRCHFGTVTGKFEANAKQCQEKAREKGASPARGGVGYRNPRNCVAVNPVFRFPATGDTSVRLARVRSFILQFCDIFRRSTRDDADIIGRNRADDRRRHGIGARGNANLRPG